MPGADPCNPCPPIAPNGQMCPSKRKDGGLVAALEPDPFAAKAIAVGVPKLEGRAHHIFPVSEFDNMLGRKLCCFGIDLDGADNGVRLPYCDYPDRKEHVHRGGNTREYVEEVSRRLEFAKNKPTP